MIYPAPRFNQYLELMRVEINLKVQTVQIHTDIICRHQSPLSENEMNCSSWENLTEQVSWSVSKLDSYSGSESLKRSLRFVFRFGLFSTLSMFQIGNRLELFTYVQIVCSESYLIQAKGYLGKSLRGVRLFCHLFTAKQQKKKPTPKGLFRNFSSNEDFG